MSPFFLSGAFIDAFADVAEIGDAFRTRGALKLGQELIVVDSFRGRRNASLLTGEQTSTV
jgi:hypothetical protein